MLAENKRLWDTKDQNYIMKTLKIEVKQNMAEVLTGNYTKGEIILRRWQKQIYLKYLL